MKHLESLARQILLIASSAAVCGCATHIASTALFSEAFNEYQPAFHEGLRVEIKSGDVVYSGSGAWMGHGEILTAFHMLYNPPFVMKDTDTITVLYRGVRMPARPLYRGDLDGNYDLELLKISADHVFPQLDRLEVPSVCSSLEPVGAPVYISAYDNVYKTFTSPVFVRAYKERISSHGTTALVSHGVSGSPVFDYRMRCLAGIVSFGNYGQVPNSPAEDKCLNETLQKRDPHQGSTCAVSMGTEFTDADAIRSFMKLAREYEAQHATD